MFQTASPSATTPSPDAVARRTDRHIALLQNLAPGLFHSLGLPPGGYGDLFYSSQLGHRISLHRRVRPAFPYAVRPAVAGYFEDGAALRVLAELDAFASTSHLAPESLQAVAESVAARAREASLLFPDGLTGAPDLDPPPLPADTPDRISEREKTSLLESVAEAAFCADAHVEAVRISYQDRLRRTSLVTSDERRAVDAQFAVELRVEVTVSVGGRRASGHAFAGGPFGFGTFLFHPPEATAIEAVERALRRADARPAPAGPVRVVLDAGWGGAWLHEAVGHLLEAESILSGASPFHGRFGQTVAAEALTLVDDGTAENGRGTARIDDEAVPTRRTVLIEEGRLHGVLTDLRHAVLLERPPTGNGRRADYRHPPRPRMTNLLLAPGRARPEDLVADVQDGLFVEQIIAGDLDPETHRFTLRVADARRIEHGRLTHPVADLVLTGDARSMLRHVRGVADDFAIETARGKCVKQESVVPVSVGQPTVLIDGLAAETAAPAT